MGGGSFDHNPTRKGGRKIRGGKHGGKEEESTRSKTTEKQKTEHGGKQGKNTEENTAERTCPPKHHKAALFCVRAALEDSS